MTAATLDPNSPITTQFDLQMDLDERVMYFSGDLDIASTPLLFASITSVLDHRPGNLTVDLSQVTFLHEAAVRVLTKIRNLQRTAGHTLRLTPTSAQLKRALLAGGPGTPALR
jgi:anti-anti-sigma factor